MLEIVGSGAMGVVWKAKDERLGRTVAIKQLLVRYGLSESHTQETRRRAMREARIAARLQHRNAIAMYDVAEHGGDPCLVMEFLPSRSLSAVLEEKGSLPPEEVAEIGAQVAAALAAAHAVGIAHRDVKPGNILLADNGTVKITDFGISRALDDGTVTTQTGMLAGTPAYLAPEIARGDDPTRASDVFSLGSTLYHAVEGRPPFGTNGNPLALLHQVASGNVPQPKKAGPLTPALLSLLQVDPATRPTMAAAVTALSEPASVRMPTVAAALAAPAPADPPPAPATAALPKPAPAAPKPPGQQRRTPLLIALIALLALAVVAIAVIALNQNDEQPGANQNPETITETVSNEPPTSAQDPSTEPGEPIPADGPIGYTEAGELVIAYYGNPADADRRWSMLSPNGQAAFGNRQGFDEHWAQFTDVSSKDANGVTPNEDGSVTVPVLVTYTTASGSSEERLHIRVTRHNGQLLIDGEAK